MSLLRSFRPWILRSDHPDLSIHDLLQTERKSEDRSQFVRFARVAAAWNQWVESGNLVQESEANQPTLDGWQYAVCPIEKLQPTQSVLPVRKEERQRLLEGSQVYFDPICVTPYVDCYAVVGNHDAYAAAIGFQEDMARPGKVRSSDFALIAIHPNPTLESHKLVFKSNYQFSEAVEKLKGIGFDECDPQNAGHQQTQVFLPDLAMHSNRGWSEGLAEQLKSIFALRSLDLNSKTTDDSQVLQPNELAFHIPVPCLDTNVSTAQSPQDSFSLANVPPTGAIMWSLKDF